MADEQLIVMAKAARPGWAKTRLADALGPAGAVAAYQRIVSELLEHLAPLAPVEIRHAPDDAGEEIRPWLRPGWTLAPQGGGDLGERLVRAFAGHFARGARRVAIIGADCPDVTADDIRIAWQVLQANDLVLGPATDGGYWLIGLQQPQPELFRDMPWSSDRLRSCTEQRAEELGLSCGRLRVLADVDSEVDWASYRRRRGETPA